MDGAVLEQAYCPAHPELELRQLTVAEALSEAASRWPDREAVIEALPDGALSRRWTFAQLKADADDLAAALLSRFMPGERIAVWAPNIPEWVLLEFALARAGLVLVTVNPGYQPRELTHVLRQSGAVGLFLVGEHRGNPMARIAAEVAADLPALREIVDMEDRAALFARTAEPPAFPNMNPRDPAQIQYTSGTTGLAKGVLLHHGGLTDNARHMFELAGFREGGTNVLMMPLFHTGGCGLNMLGSVQLGCRTIVIRQFDPALVLDLSRRLGADGLLGVPTMIQAVLEAHHADPLPLPALRTIVSGGAMVAPELVRAATERFGCGFATVYGQTESSPLLAMIRPDDERPNLFETVGRALPHVEIAIFDVDGSGIAPEGAQGEICARGYGVMLGYHEDPAATAHAIDAQGWLHTGDLGTIDAQGYVRITGRLKDMIIRGGENLFPAEIETVLLEHPDVAEVAVVGVPDAFWGETVAAFVRPAPGRSMDAVALKAHCRERIAAQKSPAHWIAVETWPLTGSGKIQKYALRERWIAERGGEPG
jgi:fatty-acyl-CoA synthase